MCNFLKLQKQPKFHSSEATLCFPQGHWKIFPKKSILWLTSTSASINTLCDDTDICIAGKDILQGTYQEFDRNCTNGNSLCEK